MGAGRKVERERTGYQGRRRGENTNERPELEFFWGRKVEIVWRMKFWGRRVAKVAERERDKSIIGRRQFFFSFFSFEGRVVLIYIKS